MAGFRLTGPAEHDIAELLDWSETTFGYAASRRYEVLIATALRDITLNWRCTGSVTRDDLGMGWRVYHLRHSRRRVARGTGHVQAPRHVLVYRLSNSHTVIVLCVLDDSMDLGRHLDARPP